MTMISCKATRLSRRVALSAGACLLMIEPAQAQSADAPALLQQVAEERARLEEQQRALDAQRLRLQVLEERLLGSMTGTGTQQVAGRPGPAATVAAADPQQAQSGSTTVPLPASPPAAAPSVAQVPPAADAPAQPVGEAPTDQRQVQVAVLADQGGVITSAGRLTLEPSFEYAHADRNRVLFRGVQIPAAILVGAFNIDESRQDILTAGYTFRLGVTNRLEVNARVPLVYRSDRSVFAPVANNNGVVGDLGARSIDRRGLGDVEFGARYQLTDGGAGLPYVIVGVQAVAPTGSNPFDVPRDMLGTALRGSTGAGFWGVTPTITAILPSDPAVLFGTFGYTYNFGKTVNAEIGQSLIERVEPLGEPSVSLGMAVSLNTRTSFSAGYAHTWSMGTRTRLRTRDIATNSFGNPTTTTTRDLQLGRFLFGVSYRVDRRTVINWNIEAGVTDDASDLRTTLRIPITLSVF